MGGGRIFQLARKMNGTRKRRVGGSKRKGIATL